jgi:nucleoside-diphosphate-sugar epimerase
MKKIIVCGAGGFIGSHLVKRLKQEGHWVRGIDIAYPEFSKTVADEYLLLDLREKEKCDKAIKIEKGYADEVYQLAADMGGAGYIESAECDIMRNSALININMIYAAATKGVKRYFFSSSVCVYRDMMKGESELNEKDAIPANPDNEYGWEKLYEERMAAAYSKKYGITVRIGRFQNTYGPECSWRGGREKAVAAICRKVAEAVEGGAIEVWGDGKAIRSHAYIDDLIEGIYLLMNSDLEGPTNIGSPEYVSVDDLVDVIIKTSGKIIKVKHIEGPVGVKSRNFSNKKIYSIGWRPEYSLEEGIKATYPWIEAQVKAFKGK